MYGSSYGDMDTTALVTQPKDTPARDSTVAESILRGKQAAREARRAARHARGSQHPDDDVDDLLPRDADDRVWTDTADHLMSQDSPRAPSPRRASTPPAPGQPLAFDMSPAATPPSARAVSFAHMPLKQKHVEKIFEIAFRAGLTSDLVKEVEVALTEIMESRKDNQLSIQDLLDAISEFMELDYSCADLSTRPKMLPKFVGLAPHIADIIELANPDDLALDDLPSNSQDDNDDGDYATSTSDVHAHAKPALTTGAGEQKLSSDEKSGEEESGEESGEEELDEESGEEELDEESSDDEDEDTGEDEDPRDPR